MTEIRPISATEVVLVGSEVLYQWREQHSLPVPGREYMPRFKRHQWDGMWVPGKWCVQSGDHFEYRLSVGLAPRVLQDLGHDPALPAPTDLTVVEKFLSTHPKVPLLRDYQSQALEQVLRRGWGRVALATNAGKGAVIALLAEFGYRVGVPVLVCCDEVSVYDALQGELREWAPAVPVCLVRAGTESPPALPGVTLAMVPTLARRVGSEQKAVRTRWQSWIGAHGMVLLDEADKATAARWRQVLRTATGSQWRVGFSGTFPTDLLSDLQLDQMMGPVLVQVKNLALVERGVSAKPTVTLRGFDVSSQLTCFPKDWWWWLATYRRLWVYEQAIVYNAERHQFIASLIRPDTSTVVVVNRIDHGEQLQDVIPGSVFIDGSKSEKHRITTLEAFRIGKFRVLVVTKILDRGTNRLGWADDVIFASGEGSQRQTLQRIGRGLRRAGGKETLRLVDVLDRVPPETQTNKSIKVAAAFLHSAARRRAQLYGSEGFVVEVIR